MNGKEKEGEAASLLFPTPLQGHDKLQRGSPPFQSFSPPCFLIPLPSFSFHICVPLKASAANGFSLRETGDHRNPEYAFDVSLLAVTTPIIQ